MENVTNKRLYDDMSKAELISELTKRDETIQALKKAKVAAPSIDPEKVAKKASRLRTMASQQIKKQMKWKPKCKTGAARFSWTSICDEPTFRAFMNLEDKDKTKGGKIPLDRFQDEILGTYVTASIRYDTLVLKGNHVTVTYKKEENEIRISGGYGI